MAAACNLFVFFDARYENRPAGPWPKHMHICLGMEPNCQPVREAVSYRGLFTAGWFGVREKHYSRLEIYDRLRTSEQVDGRPMNTLGFIGVINW